MHDKKTLLYRATHRFNKAFSRHDSPWPPSVWQNDSRTHVCGREESHLFRLKSRPDLQRLQNPELMLGSLNGIVILDEIQIMPELFNVLRVLVDRPKNRTRFLILGSASPGIIKNVSETLAGRVEFVELSGFDLQEAGTASGKNSGCEEDFPDPSSPGPMETAWLGVRVLSEPSWNGISPSGE